MVYGTNRMPESSGLTDGEHWFPSVSLRDCVDMRGTKHSHGDLPTLVSNVWQIQTWSVRLVPMLGLHFVF